eukprot:8453786-Karenia_brevis.AAC.1
MAVYPNSGAQWQRRFNLMWLQASHGQAYCLLVPRSSSSKLRYNFLVGFFSMNPLLQPLACPLLTMVYTRAAQLPQHTTSLT